jgi:hypothetical protein
VQAHDVDAEAGEPVGEPVGLGYYVMYARKGEAGLVKKLNEAIILMIRNGDLEQIYRKYGIWDEQQAELVELAEKAQFYGYYGAVTAEVMFGWKVHSLVEHGPRGRWHAKTMADLYLLLRHVRLEQTLVRSCVEAAFASQRMPLTALDGFLDDPTWGQSRGSRNKWKSYVKKSPWVTFTLAEAFPVVRDTVKRVVRR